MRKSISVLNYEHLKSVAFDYTAPLFLDPEILISEHITTDEVCDKLLSKLVSLGHNENAVAFLFCHEGFRVYCVVLDNFVILKQYMIDNVCVINLKKYGLHSITFDSYTHAWSEKSFYNFKRGNKPDKVVRTFGYFIAKYTHVYDKTYVSEIKVTEDSLYLVDMTFRNNGRETTLSSLSSDYPEIVSALRGRIKSIDNLTNKSKLIKSYIPIIDMMLI